MSGNPPAIQQSALVMGCPRGHQRLGDISEQALAQAQRRQTMRQDMQHQQAMQHPERMFSCLEPATADDYTSWLHGFVDQGGKPNRSLSNPMSQDKWYKATKDFTIVPLYGLASVNIIVPEGIAIDGIDPGHSNLFFFEDFKTRGMKGSIALVPVYSDTQLQE
jgi:hypothetical protein